MRVEGGREHIRPARRPCLLGDRSLVRGLDMHNARTDGKARSRATPCCCFFYYCCTVSLCVCWLALPFSFFSTYRSSSRLVLLACSCICVCVCVYVYVRGNCDYDHDDDSGEVVTYTHTHTHTHTYIHTQQAHRRARTFLISLCS